MAGGGADGAVRVDGHDVQIAEGAGLHKGTELGVHQLQKLFGVGHHIGLVVLIGAAPAGFGRVGHGDKLHVFHRQPAQDGLLTEPAEIGKAQVGLHVLLKDLGKLVDLGDVLHLEHLLHHSLQKCLLGLDAAQVAVRIAVLHVVVVAVAQHLHGIVAGEQAIPLLLVDVQILIGVVIVHVPGHIEPHAAHGVHDLAHGLPLHHDLVVWLKADQLGDLLVEGLDALVPAAAIVVHGVDALDVVGDVHHGVPGDGHDGGLLIGHVVAGQQHGVRVAAAAGIPAQDEHRIVVLALALTAGLGTHALAIVDFLFFRLGVLARQLRPDEQALAGHHHDQHHRQHRRHGDEDLLLPGQTAGLFRFFLPGLFPARDSLSILFFQCLSILSMRPAPPAWPGAQGFPYRSFPGWSSPVPNTVPRSGLYSIPAAICPPPENPGRVRYNLPDK